LTSSEVGRGPQSRKESAIDCDCDNTQGAAEDAAAIAEEEGPFLMEEAEDIPVPT
jgi:hypothetical protein